MNVSTQFNVALGFLHFQRKKAWLSTSLSDVFALWCLERGVRGSVCPWTSKWWSLHAKRDSNWRCWWITAFDTFAGKCHNVCLYFIGTKIWHLLALDLFGGLLFHDKSPTDGHWVISGFHSVMRAETNGEEWLLEIKKAYFIIKKYFPYYTIRVELNYYIF